MSHDDETAKEALTTLGVGPAAKELYVDLLRPTAIELGKNLVVAARLLTLALSPLHGLVWGAERFRDWLAASLLKRLAHVSPDQLQPPPLYVAGQVLQQLPFCADQENLREMYANLLASAMNTATASEVHPAFVHVIQQLTPDEALVLQAISMNPNGVTLEELVNPYDRHVSKDKLVPAQFRRLCESAHISTPALSDAYLDNLLRLKIVNELRWSEGEFRHAGHHEYGDYDAHVENRDGRLIELSSFGESFLRTCVRPPTPG